MIVTIGKHIQVQCSGWNLHLSRTAETPGLVTVTDREGNQIGLPANQNDAQHFIESYLRVINEDIEYRESNVE